MTNGQLNLAVDHGELRDFTSALKNIESRAAVSQAHDLISYSCSRHFCHTWLSWGVCEAGHVWISWCISLVQALNGSWRGMHNTHTHPQIKVKQKYTKDPLSSHNEIMTTCFDSILKGQRFWNVWLNTINHNNCTSYKHRGLMCCWFQWDKAGPVPCQWVCICEFRVHLWMLCFHSPSVASGSEAEGVKPKNGWWNQKRKENPSDSEGGWLAVTQTSQHLLISRFLRSCHLCASLWKRWTRRKWQEILPPWGSSDYCLIR